ncbi:MAG: nuclear transport factor 2 family protein [Desulfobulbaceae bacterium]|nr:MAG: nuclear transport factor 2 family protein [Desulfobulbaceae bacterium]
MTLTENDAATAFAKAWNRLDCTAFLELLAEDAVYESQWVFTPLEGREAISHYLAGKMETIKASDKKVRAELTTARCGYKYGKPCVVLKQGDNRDTDSVMVFEVDGDRIRRCDLCAPELYDQTPTGIYPV